MFEARVGCAVEFAGDEGKVFGDEILEGAFGEFGRDAETAVAFIEVAGAGHVFEIGDEGAVISSAGTVWACAGFEAVAGFQWFDWAVRVMGIAVAPRRVNGKTIRSPADEDHLVAGVCDFGEEAERETVIMIRAVGLDVGVAFVHTEVEMAGHGFVLPAGIAVAVPPFVRAGIEGNAVDGHAEGIEDV